MYPSLKAAVAFVFSAGIYFLAAPLPAQSVPSIQRVQVLRASTHVEIEIEASERVIPQTNLLSNPDRLVVDFVNARPSAGLRSVSLNREEVKDLRIGLFSSDPPVTRIVVDLNGAQPYQVFPSGKTIVLKIGLGGAKLSGANAVTGAVLVNTRYAGQPAKALARVAPVNPRFEVAFQDGLLSIHSSKANLSEILFAIHERTGAEIEIPAGAEQDQVAADFGPGPAAEVLAHLLNGSKFNFMILSSATDPQALDRVILTPRMTSVAAPDMTRARTPVAENEGESQTPAPTAEERGAMPDAVGPKPSDAAVPD